MNTRHALQNLKNNTATEEEIQLIKQLLASGEISIGGNVSNSVIIQGSGNNVQVFQLESEILELLGGRKLLGCLDRDLNGDEIAAGLARLESELPLRAPVLMSQFQGQARRLRPTLKTNPNVLSESARKERLEALAHINSLCMEALDISFNAVATGETPPEYEARCPFRGLESFRVEDREFFFGREELTKKLIGKIQSHPFLAVLGASGSGKSSLVMAGMIPALDLDYAIIRPGTNPLDALDSVRGKSLLVVDQFEELFTLTREEKTRADFISVLLDLTKSGRVIITLRSDFLGEVGAYRSLSGEIQNHLEIIPPMNADELRCAMEGQAHWARLEFEADLSQQILDDVAGEPGAMPLLQHALWELWNRRHGRHLRANVYRAFGGVRQAITSTAEKVYDDCSKPEQEQVRDIFLRLTLLDEGDEGRDTRRRVPLGDLIPSGADAASTSALLDKLANARLIVKTVDDVTEVEVAHEALIRHWERLRIWLNEDRDNLRLRESVSESAKEWEKSGKHESLLNFRWVKLDEALLLAQDSRYRLTEIEQTYLSACVALRNKEQRERERRLRWTAIASGVVAVIYLLLGSFGVLKSIEATNQAKIALARQLSAQAQSIFVRRDSNQQVAVLLAIQSMRMFPAFDAAQTLQNHTLAEHIASMVHFGSVYSFAFGPDGNRVVSGSRDGVVLVWDATNGAELSHMNLGSGVWSVAFNPDGSQVVSGSEDSTARVWDATSGEEITRITHDDAVTCVDFSPDGRWVVSGSDDGIAIVWSTGSGEEIARMAFDGPVESVAFSPDGQWIVSGSQDSTARIWDATSGEEIARTTHGGTVYSTEFSLDGQWVVSAGSDNTARVWRVSRRTESPAMIHDGKITSIAISSDGTQAVLGSEDGAVIVWDVASGEEIIRMAHNRVVTSVAFSPDKKWVISESKDYIAKDNIAILWDIASGKEIARIKSLSVAFSSDGKQVVVGNEDGSVIIKDSISGAEIARLFHYKNVNFVAFSPDGKRVVSGGIDASANIWDVASGERISQMELYGPLSLAAFSPNGERILTLSAAMACIWDISSEREIACTTVQVHNIVTSVLFSPNGERIVLGNTDGIVFVWDADSGKELARMTHDDWITSVAFSQDRKWVVSGSQDNTARVWDANNGQEVARVTHNSAVESVAFTPQYAISGSADGTVHVWVYRPEDLIAEACLRVTRNLTRDEWKQYIGDALPYQAVCPNLLD